MTVRSHCSVLYLADILGPHLHSLCRIVARDVLLGRSHGFEFLLEREASVDLGQRGCIGAFQVTPIHIDGIPSHRHKLAPARSLLLVDSLGHDHRLLQRSDSLIRVLLIQLRWDTLTKRLLFVGPYTGFARRRCHGVVLRNVESCAAIATDLLA